MSSLITPTSSIDDIDPKLLIELQAMLTDLLAGDESIITRPEYRALNPQNIQLALDYLLKNPMLDDSQRSYLATNSWRVNYRDEPPNPNNFITEKYLGRAALHTYKRIEDVFKAFMDPTKPYRNLILYPHIGWGKEVDRYNTRIHKPEGPVIADEIRVGDQVCTPDGGVANVTAVKTWSDEEFANVYFSDGRKLHCGLDHYFKAAKSTNGAYWNKELRRYEYDKSKSVPCWKIITIREILKDIEKNPGARWFIPTPSAVQHNEVKHVIPPYVLGALLGAGFLDSSELYISGDDEAIIEKVVSSGLGFEYMKLCEKATVLYHARSLSKEVKAELARLGLLNTRSATKFIPEEYLYDSIENRIALLQGLMDTDGSAHKQSGMGVFYTTSPQLRDSITTLVRGLGGRASWSTRPLEKLDIARHEQYDVSISFPENTFPLFSLPRKQEWIDKNFNRPRTRSKTKHLYITNIERTANAEGLCIEIDSEDRLFLVDDYIVTHNSYLSTLINIYIAIHLSMMRNPYKFFGLNPASVLSQLLVSFSLKKSSELLLEPLIAILEQSPFFEKVHTRDGMVKKDQDFERQSRIDKIYWTTAVPTSAIQMSNGANFKLVSNVQNLLGLSVVSGTMTELSFFREAGKALTLDSRIYTPDGYCLMRDISVGSVVCTPDGKTSVVRGVYPQGKEAVYSVTFSDGRTVKASGGHLWKAAHHHGTLSDGTKKIYWQTVTTEQMKSTLKESQGWRIELPEPVMHSKPVCLPIPAYTLGVLLGDGNIESYEVGITSHVDDYEEIKGRIEGELIEHVHLSEYRHNNIVHYSFRKEAHSYRNPMMQALRALGLQNKKCWDKFIPKGYLYADVATREALLQGLMDTDGTVSAEGICSYSTTSKQLAQDVVELVRGLGGWATLKYNNPKVAELQLAGQQSGRPEYTVSLVFRKTTVQPFFLSRKLARWRSRYERENATLREHLYVTSIEEAGFEETQCIAVDSEDKLYLTDGYIVTHNTDEYIMRVFNDLKNRIDSRMKGNYFGRSILDSSPNTLDSPIDDYVVNHARKDPTNYVVDGSQWKWAPEEYDTDQTFQVFVGGKGQPPRILETEEEAALISPDKLIDVPLKLKQFFIDDLYKALKDRAGIPSGSADSLIYDYGKIERVFDKRLRSLYTHIEASSESPPKGLIWRQINHLFFKQKAGKTEFWYKPHLPRCLAVDQSISGDVSAIAVMHVERLTGTDEQIFVVDMVIPIAPMGKRVNLDAIRFFIEDLRNLGNMTITHVSFDQFQSESSIQYLKSVGFDCERLSVDLTTDPYFNMLSLIETGRLVAGRNLYIKNNLKSLKLVRIKSGDNVRVKVDHEDARAVITAGNEDWDKSMIGFFAKDATDAIAAACELLRKYCPVAYDAWDSKYLDNLVSGNAEHREADDKLQSFLKGIGARVVV